VVNISDICRDHADLARHLERSAPVIETIAAELAGCLAAGGTVFACGNGGSASQAEHFAGELLGRFTLDRKALPVFALSQNSAVVTAVANDTTYAQVYSRQIEGLGSTGDCLLALSTSGNSDNVIEACKAARRNGMRVISLTGRGGGLLGPNSDITLDIPSTNTARIQEMHLVVLHLLCQIVEERLFAAEGGA
jgi:D-sedoheptulose 7-phosphate isomerase